MRRVMSQQVAHNVFPGLQPRLIPIGEVFAGIGFHERILDAAAEASIQDLRRINAADERLVEAQKQLVDKNELLADQSRMIESLKEKLKDLRSGVAALPVAQQGKSGQAGGNGG